MRPHKGRRTSGDVVWYGIRAAIEIVKTTYMENRVQGYVVNLTHYLKRNDKVLIYYELLRYM